MLFVLSSTRCAPFRESSSCEADPACYSDVMRIGRCLHGYLEQLPEMMPADVLHLVEGDAKLVSHPLV